MTVTKFEQFTIPCFKKTTRAGDEFSAPELQQTRGGCVPGYTSGNTHAHKQIQHTIIDINS